MNDALPLRMTYPEQRRHIQSYLKQFAQAAPDAMQGFTQLHRAGAVDGALDAKTKELIALSIAVASRCDGCIAFHTHDALNAGANREEVVDALRVAILMGGGPAAMYATHVMQAMDEFEREAAVK